MKRITYVLMPVFVLALTAAAFAQESNVVEAGEDTVKITVSGGIDLDYVHMNGEILEAKGWGQQSDVNLIFGHVNVRLDIDLSNKVSAVVDLGNYVDTDFLGAAGGSANGYFGNDAEITDVQVLEASVTLSEFLNPALTFKLGVNPYAIHFVPGGSMLFEPRFSDTLMSTMSPTATPAAAAALGYASPTALVDVFTVQMDVNELQPTGLVGTYAR
jgi:hypothetical protein